MRSGVERWVRASSERGVLRPHLKPMWLAMVENDARAWLVSSDPRGRGRGFSVAQDHSSVSGLLGFVVSARV